VNIQRSPSVEELSELLKTMERSNAAMRKELIENDSHAAKTYTKIFLDTANKMSTAVVTYREKHENFISLVQVLAPSNIEQQTQWLELIENIYQKALLAQNAPPETQSRK